MPYYIVSTAFLRLFSAILCCDFPLGLFIATFCCDTFYCDFWCDFLRLLRPSFSPFDRVVKDAQIHAFIKYLDTQRLSHLYRQCEIVQEFKR